MIKSNAKYDNYADAVIAYLVAHPNSSLKQIEAAINSYHTTTKYSSAPRAARLIRYIRVQMSDKDILVCDHRTHRYKIADNKMESSRWTHDRRRYIAEQLRTIHRTTAKSIATFGRDPTLVRVEMDLRHLIEELELTL